MHICDQMQVDSTTDIELIYNTKIMKPDEETLSSFANSYKRMLVYVYYRSIGGMQKNSISKKHISEWNENEFHEYILNLEIDDQTRRTLLLLLVDNYQFYIIANYVNEKNFREFLKKNGFKVSENCVEIIKSLESRYQQEKKRK